MALNNTMNDMERLLKQIGDDLEKTIYGNKAAAQRVRTGTIRLERIAKLFRKESIHAEKKGLLVRKPRPKKTAKKDAVAHGDKKAASPKKGKKAGKKAAPKKAAPKKAAHKKVAKKAAPKKAAPKKAAPKKAAAPKKKIKAKGRTLSLRRPTAKLPRKHMRAR